MRMIRIDDDIFSYSYLENIVDNNKVVFVYLYNNELKKELNDILEQNINDVIEVYNPNVSIIVNVKNLEKIINIFSYNIKLPSILIFKNGDLIEFFSDAILIKK